MRCISSVLDATVLLLLSPTLVTGFGAAVSQSLKGRSYTKRSTLFPLHASTQQQYADTPVVLPDFKNKEEYLQYMESVATLPIGFATGTADGTFISKEAPGLGNLKIRGTVIYLTEGPTDNWAAVYTSNKVRRKYDKMLGKQRKIANNGRIKWALRYAPILVHKISLSL